MTWQFRFYQSIVYEAVDRSIDGGFYLFHLLPTQALGDWQQSLHLKRKNVIKRQNLLKMALEFRKFPTESLAVV